MMNGHSEAQSSVNVDDMFQTETGLDGDDEDDDGDGECCDLLPTT
jgi:hypothetical protein